MFPKVEWPDGKQFAFTIFDDPDFDTVNNVSTIYSFLDDLGLRTTKAVWPIRGTGSPKVGGSTCEDDEYLKWILALQQRGFEIALHNVTHHTSSREQTAKGIERFQELFGHYPYSMANHTGCEESIYWGRERLSGIQRRAYDLLQLVSNHEKALSYGHVENSHLYWGDICKDRIKYVRNFVFSEINTLKACPIMPYHDPDRPRVNFWFAASEGPRVESFNAMMSENNQDRLEEEGGACIMYTHLACGFLRDGKIHGHFKALMQRMSRLNGWFVPVRTLLDFIQETRGRFCISRAERNQLERRWIYDKILRSRGRS
jgi:hypothetical protein